MNNLEFFLLNVFQWWPTITKRTAKKFLGSNKVPGINDYERIPLSFKGLKKVGLKNQRFHKKKEKIRWVIKKGDTRSVRSKKIDLKNSYYLELTTTHL